MRFAAAVAAVSAWTIARHFGAAGLVLVGILGDSPLPLPGAIDTLTIVLAAAAPSWWPIYAGLATTGSVIGGYLAYRVGRKGGKELLEKKLAKPRVEKVYRVFEKGGFGTVFVAALLPPPIPMTPFTVGAGALNFPLRKFVIALAAGRVARFTAVAWLASRFGGSIISFFAQYYRPTLYVLIALLVIGAVAGAALLVRRRKKPQQVRKAA